MKLRGFTQLDSSGDEAKEDSETTGELLFRGEGSPVL
jgi:hypothetical protein